MKKIKTRTLKNLILLLKEEQEMNKFNFKVIDKILNVYAPKLKRGEI